MKEKFNFILDSQDFVNYIRTKNLAKLLKTYDLSIELFYKVLSEISGEQLIPEEPPAIHIFFSYATKNSKDYNIKELSKKLTEYEDIKDAFYWEEDMKGNAMKYMNDCITKSNVLVLFCSPEAKESWLVELEWTSALQKRKVIIPVFINEEDVPTLVSAFLGLELENTEDILKLVDKLHELIHKRMKEEA